MHQSPTHSQTTHPPPTNYPPTANYQSSKLAFLFNLFMTCCIFGSVVALLLETVPAANEKPHANTNPTDIMEWLDGTSGHSINGKKFLELFDHVSGPRLSQNSPRPQPVIPSRDPKPDSRCSQASSRSNSSRA